MIKFCLIVLCLAWWVFALLFMIVLMASALACLRFVGFCGLHTCVFVVCGFYLVLGFGLLFTLLCMLPYCCGFDVCALRYGLAVLDCC